ncbi:G-protein coupled receptor Mth2 [Nilaparvata lugens]|uniref:G-protein coupled receptor Mth2 n=1 Tax=Nilaparvata lugens TaxID=108931 RepID=UPI00193D600F|nr:G-protein coupled receptor Mth2 [Nilaparvata lugens]XP_022197925.2 G-protein coupled receptor Mth2 [Nilaparvata lugens]XP_039292359.1 G-protein coupled receptor Mth2 [Nilaparvata lugens]XP_039292360.1 G-protein coupled receptor Mth2 [Nilaparvata lugens]XP_039292362.1 G-protein coupled receptor Mth2 [Nilaparvata lugens]XP_039292363.1 G-protein coupled receptor Mth2 [Nilaparvata lugens]XP_039292364.1 G-protein coupled receptor Mth2 [Nilaparvata lugens]XP_039292365.1 G-protein coupled recept
MWLRNRMLQFVLELCAIVLCLWKVEAVTLKQAPDKWVVPKCCPLGFTLSEQNPSSCVPTPLMLEPEYWGADTLHPNDTQVDVLIGNPCPYGKYRLEPHKDSLDEFVVLPNGSLLVPFQTPPLLQITDYCLDLFETPSGPVALPLICFSSSDEQSPDFWKKLALTVYPMGLLLSVPFLLVTLLIYALIPELRDTRGKSLCCHISCLILAYIALATVQLGGPSLSENMCVMIAFLIQFSFLACFFWLNVLCFDTWWRVTSPFTYSNQKIELKKMLWYSLYAWCCPLLVLLSTVLMELTPFIPPSYLKPNFAYNCWFSNDLAALGYFYGPMGFILISNMVFFLLSARRLCKPIHFYADTKAEAPVSQKTALQRRLDMFKQCAFLFVVMGVNWFAELISWALGGPSQVWFVTDVLNTLQGVIIFIIFVLYVPRAKRLAMQFITSHFCQSE